MKRVLVTGAGGFIGSYLCDHLASQGYHVIASARSGLDQLRAVLPNCEVIELDVMDPAVMELEIEADAVVHAATANDIISRDFMAGIDLGVRGTHHLLELAKKNGIGTFVFYSTFQVYGTELVGLVTEETPADSEKAYGLNHRFGELCVEMHARQNPGFRGAVLRPSNVYGRILSPTVSRWTLVPMCFCREAVEKGEINLLSSGLQIRNFVSLEALSRACRTVIDATPEGFEIYNAASTSNRTILEVAELTAEVYREHSGRDLKLNVHSEEPRESNRFEVAIDKLLDLGFKEPEEPTMAAEIGRIFDFLASDAAPPAP